MAITRRIVATGISPFAANQIQGDVGTFTPVGSSQSTAVVLSSAINTCSTVPTSTGAQLPTEATNPSDEILVYNGGSNTLSVYGTSTDTINAGSAGAAFSVTSHKAAFFTRLTSTSWLASLSA